ncbi:hypothetical protein, partial [Streptomyces brasiliscabiei]|uniref:hypothetical protein n=1 Tax=Streptomyces brasiliscabiei TaxID=2736302 RepID=UPI001C0F3CEA
HLVEGERLTVTVLETEQTAQLQQTLELLVNPVRQPETNTKLTMPTTHKIKNSQKDNSKKKTKTKSTRKSYSDRTNINEKTQKKTHKTNLNNQSKNAPRLSIENIPLKLLNISQKPNSDHNTPE